VIDAPVVYIGLAEHNGMKVVL